MLNITRTANAVCSSSALRRGLALARDFAKKRFAFGAMLSQKPLHNDTLARVQADYEAMFHLAFFAAEMLGRQETRQLSDDQSELLRLVTPIAKLTNGKQAVSGMSEIVESFGGAGYVEDTGIPVLLRDTQVLSIWEGTTNVLALDVMRSIAKGQGLRLYNETVSALARSADGTEAAPLGQIAIDATRRASTWAATHSKNISILEAGARRFAMTLGRALQLALLVRHAVWATREEGDARSLAAARRFAREGIDLIGEGEIRIEESALLANDE
jgi:hypothetical protein